MGEGHADMRLVQGNMQLHGTGLHLRGLRNKKNIRVGLSLFFMNHRFFCFVSGFVGFNDLHRITFFELFASGFTGSLPPGSLLVLFPERPPRRQVPKRYHIEEPMSPAANGSDCRWSVDW